MFFLPPKTILTIFFSKKSLIKGVFCCGATSAGSADRIISQTGLSHRQTGLYHRQDHLTDGIFSLADGIVPQTGSSHGRDCLTDSRRTRGEKSGGKGEHRHPENHRRLHRRRPLGRGNNGVEKYFWYIDTQSHTVNTCAHTRTSLSTHKHMHTCRHAQTREHACAHSPTYDMVQAKGTFATYHYLYVSLY